MFHWLPLEGLGIHQETSINCQWFTATEGQTSQWTAALNSEKMFFYILDYWQQLNTNLSLNHSNDCETFLYYGEAKCSRATKGNKMGWKKKEDK